jgi:glycosyltransferase involved in cell wall biosynthesis
VKKVVIIQRALKKYRIPFYQKLKEKCERNNIELIVIYGEDDNISFNDAELEWGIKIKNKKLNLLGQSIYYQPALKYLKNADLIIVEQASKLLINYYLWLLNLAGVKRLAFWGHGKNFQTKNDNSFPEILKRIMSKHVHWWFAYNELSAEIIKKLGYPAKRISIVNNSIDSVYLQSEASKISKDKLEKIKKELNIEGNNVALFVGGMYKEKRIPFLLNACMLIKQKIPDFEIIFIGGGPEQNKVEDAAVKLKWIHYMGAKFENEIIPYFLISKLLLMPGLVGLVVLDSFSLLTPLVTTNVDYHSPEISYLIDGENGIVVKPNNDEEIYANKVIELILDENKRQKLIEGCKIARDKYSIENMVDNYFEGINQAFKI